MWFFKSKAQKRAEAEEVREGVLDGFRKEIEAAERCADPAEKFLKLESCKDTINELIVNTTDQIRELAQGKRTVPYLTIAGGTTVTATALIFGMAFPPALIFLIYPAIFGGLYAGKKAAEKAETRMLQDIAPFFDDLRVQRDKALEMADVILKNDLKALAVSPRFEEIVQKAPRVRDHFTRAFAKRMEEDDRRAPPPPPKNPPSGNGGLQL
ncbi:MAG: hypothetical protein EPN97_17950 [Alphaproteobacteria bacterium]|nr:MAG: hypothetical protein EPN97_17950 [Alphaproteobacteria bacterium]